MFALRNLSLSCLAEVSRTQNRSIAAKRGGRRRRRVFQVLCIACLCFIAWPSAKMQSPLRRITNTSEEETSINPSMSGDGRIVAFESTSDIAGAGGWESFRAIRANVSVDPPAFLQMGATRAPVPAISQDGSRIAFASKDNPLGTNSDANSEIFLYDGARLIQITNTSPGDIADRTINGNFLPSISDDGRYVAFSSNRDLAGHNADGNLEIFIFDTIAQSFTQLTNASGIVGFSDAKISGNGAFVAYICDAGTTPGTKRDLLLQSRDGATPLRVLATDVQSLAMAHGRAINDDGTRVVWATETATNSTQVFLFDGRNNSTRQITSLGSRATDVPLHPTISGDGSRIAFATRRSFLGNSDGGVDLYLFDLPSFTFSRVTNGPATATAEVVSSLNDDGSLIAFNYPRVLSGVSNVDFSGNSEIYVTETPPRPAFGSLTVFNGASFGNEPSTTEAVAPDSIAVARGNVLANTTARSQPFSDGAFPQTVGGTTVTVNGRRAQIFFVSPTEVDFLVPSETELGAAEVVVTNSDGFPSRGTITTSQAAPGIFTVSGDGLGDGVILDAHTLQPGPFDPTSGNLRLIIFSTGVRGIINLSEISITAGGRGLTLESIVASAATPGLDEVHVLVPADLRGAGKLDLVIHVDGRDSNPAAVNFAGDANRDIVINEFLADPPDGAIGDANLDGLRSASEDEFVELVNTTTHDIDLSGYHLLTRGTGASDILRHTFIQGAPATILPACTGIVVFGGGSPQRDSPAFGGAQILKASTGSLGLINSGGVITLRDRADDIVNFVTYGGSTGLNGNSNQSLTRSPDTSGPFTLHQSASGSGGSPFSPGTHVNSDPFTPCPPISRIEVLPSSATVEAGGQQQFTARAFDAEGNEVSGVLFSWHSSDTSMFMIDQSGRARALSAGQSGSTQIRASARGIQSAPATLTASAPTPVLTSVTLSPLSATMRVGETKEFTAQAKDQFCQNIGGVTFSFNSNNPATATIDLVTTNTTPGTATATVTGRLSGSAHVTATANNGSDSVTSSPAALNVEPGATATLSINNVTENEGNEGTTTFVFAVNSSSPAPIGGITFDIATQDRSATAATSDYVARAMTSQTIPAGQQTYIFEVTVDGDLLVEPPETFFVNLTNVSGATVADGQGQGTIENDDNPNLVISQIYGGGGNSGALYTNDFIEIFNRGSTTISFAATPYSIQYAGATATFGSNKTELTNGIVGPGRYFLVQLSGGGPNGTALPAADASGGINMAATAGKVSLVIGTASLTQSTCPGDDGTAPFNPGNETIADFVGYGNSANCYEGATRPAPAPSVTNAVFRKAGGCTDTNDNASDLFVSTPLPRNSSSPANDCSAAPPPVPTLAIDDATLAEGNSGTTTAILTVTLSAPAPAAGVSFDIATEDSSATAASGDYITKQLTGQIVPAGQRTYAFEVTINGDTAAESDETLLVNVTNVNGATLTDGQGVVTIQNDDSPVLSIDDVTLSEGNSGPKIFTFTVNLSAPATGAVTFDISTADGTAHDNLPSAEDNDYVARSLTAQAIPAGNQSYRFDVVVNGDLNIEQTETFFVNVTNASGATVIKGQGLGTIVNDDIARLTINDISLNEGNAGTTLFTFTVKSSLPAPAGGIIFDIGTADVTAQDDNPPGEDNDYIERKLTGQTIPAGQQTYAFNVAVNGDNALELDETFLVNITNVSHASILDGQGQGTIKNDDAVNRVNVSPGEATINRGSTQQFTATAIDAGDTTIPEARFTWQSSNPAAATINPHGLATWVGIGTTTIAATTANGMGGTVSGTATLTVQVPLLINEVLPQVPLDNSATSAIEGDSNRDGVRNSDDDEFVELFNNSTSPVELSGLVISDSTSNRFTFPANTFLAAGHSVLVFGGGAPPLSDPAFGGALIFTTSSLGLGDGGDTVTLKLPAANSNLIIDSLAYGTGSPIAAPGAQSLTRSPDLAIASAGGSPVMHSTAMNSAGRVFSPGTRADGTPFGSPAISRIEVLPDAASIEIGDRQLFTGHAYSNVGGTETEVPNVSFIWDSSDIARATVAPTTGQTAMARAVSAGSPTVRARAGGRQGTGTLDVNPPPPTLTINDVSTAEGNTGIKTLTFTVSLSSPARTGGVLFDIGTADGSAQDGSTGSEDNDYVPRSLTVQSIPAGGTTYSFDVTVNGDLNIELNETFLVNVTNVSGATIGDAQGVGTIQNDDTPRLTIDDVSASEGNSGTRTFTFTVNSSLPAPAGGITFDIATVDGTAKDHNPVSEDIDYIARNLIGQTIPAGLQTYLFDVTINSDLLDEPNEVFFVNLTNVSGATITDGQAQGTIQNDDTADLVISQVYAAGGNSGAHYTNDFVEIFNRGATRVNFAITPYSLQYAGATANFGSNKVDLTSGTIGPGKYFLLQLSSGGANGASLPAADASGSINMAATAGKVALVVNTSILNPASCPLGMTVIDFVGYGSSASCFEGTNAAPAPGATTADIRKAGGCSDSHDNAADFIISAPFPRNSSFPSNNCLGGPPPSITINDVTVTEGNNGTTTSAAFTVSLSTPAPSTDVTFDIATQNNTATTANSDYVAKALTIQVIPAGQLTYTFTVTINGDAAIENDETFFVNVTNVSGATLLDGQGAGTIHNDDLPTLSINDVTATEGNAGTKVFIFTVSLSAAAPTGGVTFDIATADGSAQDGNPAGEDNDYVARSLVAQTIPAGSQNYSFDVTVKGDLNIEANETFFVNVTNVSGATVTDSQGLGTIQNDDSPALIISDVSANEINSGTTTFTFTVTSSLPAPAGGITFDIATSDGTAHDHNPPTEDNDYVAKALTAQTIAPGNSTYVFQVTVNGDTLVEPNETFFVTLTNVLGATVSDGQGQGTIQNDDTPNLVITQIYPGGNNAGATYRNDFIEIFNRGTTTVDFAVTPYSVQYAGATAAFGATNTKTDLTSGTVAPGHYFLIQEAGGTTNGIALPQPDATGNIAMSATGGKIALVFGTTPVSATSCPGDDAAPPTNPAGNNIVDFVGYGSGGNAPNCFEGAGAAAFSTSTAGSLDPDARSIIRANSCTDTNNNSTDFSNPTTAPTARNSATASAPCP